MKYFPSTTHSLVTVMGILFTAFLFVACASTDQAADGEDNDNGELEMADVVGQWTYSASQRSPLYRGRLNLRSQGDFLTGTVDDERIGGYSVRGEIRGSRLVLRVHFPTAELVISGTVDDNRYRGQIRLSDQDIARGVQARRRGSSRMGSFTAERRDDPGPTIEEPVLEECPQVTPVGRIPCT